jgi:hypothetical protein
MQALQRVILPDVEQLACARVVGGLGAQPDKLDRVFAKRKGSKVLPFEPLKKAIGT